MEAAADQYVQVGEANINMDAADERAMLEKFERDLKEVQSRKN